MKKNDVIQKNDNFKEENIEDEEKDENDIFNKVNRFTSLANKFVNFNKENTIDKFDKIKINNNQ